MRASVVDASHGLAAATGTSEVLAEIAEYAPTAFGLIAAAGLWHGPAVRAR